MLRSTIRVVLIILLAAFVVKGQGATLTVDSQTIPGLTPKAAIVRHVIRLSGPIEEGDADKLRAILNRLKASLQPMPSGPMATIELSSAGGDVYEGLKIGYLLREYTVATVVRAKDLCLSACALAFLGGTSQRVGPVATPGRSIEIGGQVGFHNFSLNTSSDQVDPGRDPKEGMARGFAVARGGASSLVRYAATMGIDMGFVARLLGRPTEQWEYVDSNQAFIALQTCPIGLKMPPPPPQTIAVNICNHATGWFSRAEPSQARSYSSREAKRYMLAQVEGNIEGFSVKGPLVAQLKAVLATRDETLLDAVYNDLRSAGIALPEWLGTFFIVSGYSTNVYEMQCQVSFSRDNPAKFEVTLSTPDGLTKPAQLPPANCPGLFIYDRDDMLNPRR